jgi:hypothetical protein
MQETGMAEKYSPYARLKQLQRRISKAVDPYISIPPLQELIAGYAEFEGIFGLLRFCR